MYQKSLKEINEGIFIPPIIIKSSQYKGICYNKASQKWISRILFKDTRIYIGRFDTENEAYNAYQNKLQELISNNINL